MAREQRVVWIDDLDGLEVPEAEVVHRTLVLDGKGCELDLRPANSAALDAALAPFLGRGPAAEQQPEPEPEPTPEPEPEQPPAAVAPKPKPPKPRPAPRAVIETVTISEAAELLEVGRSRAGQLATAGTLVRTGEKQGREALVTMESVLAYSSGATRKRARAGSKAKVEKAPPKAKVTWDPDARCPVCGEIGVSDPELCRYCLEHPELGASPAPAPVTEQPAAPVSRPPAVEQVAPSPGPVRELSPRRAEGEPDAKLEGTALELREHYRAGLPDEVRFTYYPEVLGIEGMDFDIVETALRAPERVEVAPETFGKGYPILRFHKGDCTVALGLREPTEPAIIAAYHGSLLENDRHRVNHQGGGGARAQAGRGLPRTVGESIRRLAQQGVTVDWDEMSDARSATATFRGEDLGKVTVGAVERRQVESDYQRIVRKVEAILRRVVAS